jgi:hypothetical protein
MHSLQDASSAAAKVRNDQVVAKVIADARRDQENKDFEQDVGLSNGCIISANVKDLIDSDGENDEVALVKGDDYDGLNGNVLDGSGLSDANKIARRPCATSLGAQPSARRDRGGDIARRVATRILLKQILANSVAKKLDSNCWLGKGEKPKKAQHQEAQERMDNIMEGLVGDGSLMRQAIKDLTLGSMADNPIMTKEKEFDIISNNMKKLLEVKAKLIALSMNTADVNVLIPRKKLAELASH